MPANLLLVNDRYLHPLVYFVADKPGKKNLHPQIPLVGTQSYNKLLEWLGRMNVDISRVRLYNQADKPFSSPFSRDSLNVAVKNKHIRVVALGKNAMKYLMNAGITEFYALPHPSGSNILANNTKKLKQSLRQCQDYIYG